MPNLNGTGPLGKGSKTGLGLGNCDDGGNFNMPDEANPNFNDYDEFGYRRGNRQSNGRGFGRFGRFSHR